MILRQARALKLSKNGTPSTDNRTMNPELLQFKISRVNRAFYNRVFDDPWLGRMFQGVRREHLENQQTDFMLGALGGPKRYYGKSPGDAHPHIFVNEEIWKAREKYLQEAMAETGFPAEYGDRWLKIDAAFKPAIMKESVADCTKRFIADDIVYFPTSATAQKVG